MSGDFVPASPYDEADLPVDEDVFAGPNLSEEMRLGVACRALIDSEGYKLATGAMQERIWEAFKQCPLRDDEGLKHLRVMLKCLTEMHALLEDAAETGRMAAIQLTEEREASTPSP